MTGGLSSTASTLSSRTPSEIETENESLDSSEWIRAVKFHFHTAFHNHGPRMPTTFGAATRYLGPTHARAAALATQMATPMRKAVLT